MNKNSISECTYLFLHWKSKHLVSRKTPTHPNLNVVRICKSVRIIGRSLKSMAKLFTESVYDLKKITFLNFYAHHEKMPFVKFQHMSINRLPQLVSGKAIVKYSFIHYLYFCHFQDDPQSQVFIPVLSKYYQPDPPQKGKWPFRYCLESFFSRRLFSSLDYVESQNIFAFQ